MRFLILFWMPMLAVSLHAQSTLSISYPVSLDTADTGLGIVQMDDGYLLGCGAVNQTNGTEYACLLKIDWDANLVWKRNYYWELYTPDIAFNDPISISGDSVYMACQILEDTTSLNEQLIALDLNGDTLWSTTLTGDYWDVNIGVIGLSDANIMVYGNKGVSDVLTSARLTKLNRQGGILWDKTYNNQFGKSFVNNLNELPDGSLLLASNICHFGTNCLLNQHACLTKISKDGDHLWTKTYNKSEGQVSTFAAPLEGARIALAWTRDTFHSDFDSHPPVIFFLDSLGNIEYEYEGFKRAGYYYLTKLRQFSNGDLLGIGATYDFSDTVGVGGWLFRMTQAGELVWERRILDLRYPDLYGQFFDAMETPDGGLIAVGNIITNGWENSEVWIVKLDENGCLEPGCTGDSIYITPTKDLPYTEESNYFNIAPNPIDGYFNLEINDKFVLKETRLVINDLSGRQAMSILVESINQIVNVSNLNNGMYFATLIYEDKPLKTQKISILKR